MAETEHNGERGKSADVAAAERAVLSWAGEKLPASGDGRPSTRTFDVPTVLLVESMTAAQRSRRAAYDADAAAELLASVREHGVLQPLLARVVSDAGGSRIELVAGERRLAAARLAPLWAVPCVVARGMSDRQALEAQLVENLQREGLAPLAEAEGLAALAEAGASVAEIAERLGRSKSHVRSRLKLRSLDEAGREALAAGAIDATAAQLVARLPAGEQAEAVVEIKGLSFKQARYCLQRRGRNVANPPWGADRSGMVVPGAGWDLDVSPACGACPRRGANMVEDVDPDVCTDRACHEGKTAVFVEGIHDRWRRDGVRFVAEETAFDGWRTAPDWIELSALVERVDNARSTGRRIVAAGDFVDAADVHHVARVDYRGWRDVRVAGWDGVREAVAAAGGGVVRDKRDGDVPGPRNPNTAAERRTRSSLRAAHVRRQLHLAYREALEQPPPARPRPPASIRITADLGRRLAAELEGRLDGEDSDRWATAADVLNADLPSFLEDCAAHAAGLFDEWAPPREAKALEERCAAAGVDVAAVKREARKTFAKKP